MANKILIKRKASTGLPSLSSLTAGEFLFNIVDRRLFIAISGIAIGEVVLFNQVTLPPPGQNPLQLISINKVDGLQALLDNKVDDAELEIVELAFTAALDQKADKLTRKAALVIEADFYSGTSPFSQGLFGGALSSGAIQQRQGDPNHIGILALRDSATANGGYRIMTDNTVFRLAGGEKYVSVFQVRSALSTINHLQGFLDSSSAGLPVDGAYVRFVGDGTNVSAIATTRNNNAQTDGTTNFTCALNTWYCLIVEVQPGGSSVVYSIFSETDVLLWQETINANIPTASGRETGAGIIAWESTTSATIDLLWLDYMRIEVNRPLIR